VVSFAVDVLCRPSISRETSCIQSSMSRCVYKEAEKELYFTDRWSLLVMEQATDMSCAGRYVHMVDISLHNQLGNRID